MSAYQQAKGIINSLGRIHEAIKQNKLSLEELENVRDAIKELNFLFCHVEDINIQHEYNFKNPEEYVRYAETIQQSVVQRFMCLLEDIVEIPELIYNIRNDYKFYLRYNGKTQLRSSDYILIAV